MAVWNKATSNGKGHEGIMVLVREREGRIIQLEREDPNKQFLWFKISENDSLVKIAACYFAPEVSKTYNFNGLDHKDPFAALKRDIVEFAQQGVVLLLGDCNARTTSEQATIFCSKENCNPIFLIEVSKHQ